MLNFFPQPLFADAGAVVGLLVLIFTVVGWLVNLANSQTNPPVPQKQPQRPPRPNRERVQNEIDIFLKEVRGEAPREEQEEIVIESLPPEATRRRSRSTPPPPPVQPESPRQPQRTRLAPHVESHVGQSLSTHHLETHVGEREPQASPETLDPRAMGEMVSLQQRGRAGKPAPMPIRSLLKSQKGIQQAILINEILSKPKAMREE